MVPEDYEVMKVKVTDVEDYMPSREIKDLLGNEHLLYLEEDVRSTDRCMCLSKAKGFGGTHIFEVTAEMGNDEEQLKRVLESPNFDDEEVQILLKKLKAQEELAKIYLSKLDIDNDITAKDLLSKAKDILDTVRGKSQEQLDIKDFFRTICVGNMNFRVKYIPNLRGGVKEAEGYKKKVMKRIQEGAS